MKVSFVSILATAAIVISTVQCTSYNLWSVERQSGRVKCLPYTQEQRGSIMGNVDRMMTIWVKLRFKAESLQGKGKTHTPDLDKFRKTYGGMTDDQFNFGLTTIFNKMRDRHTLYYKAGPYGCFSVTTGVFFKLIDDSLGSPAPPKVRVVGMTDTPEVLDLIGNVLSTVAVGDELLTVNGVPFYDFILGFGANDSGGQRGAFQYLEGVLGSSNILPEVDDITLQLRRLGRNQELYTVTIPYVSSSNDECWSLSSSLYKELNGTALPKMPALKSYRQKRSVWEMAPIHEKAHRKNLNDRFYTRVTVGARQLVRSGKHAGQLIEDDGVKADVIVRSTIDDILPGDTGISAYNRIADYLYDVAKRQMDSKVYFMSEPYDRVTFEDLIDVPVVVSGVDEIMVVYQGEELGSWKGESSTVRQDCVIQVKTPKGTAQSSGYVYWKETGKAGVQDIQTNHSDIHLK
ncbi:hypothetical protein BASA83_001074 [Batrachochytrium salamandrivorans]|nr:hypothetical protein BASA83_001074 [Batrachochytrium salamandrivorans]